MYPCFSTAIEVHVTTMTAAEEIEKTAAPPPALASFFGTFFHVLEILWTLLDT